MTLRHRPQQQRSQERLDRILIAAAEVFWEVGYDSASTRAIAERADTAVGAVYRFFPDKLAIFHALEKQHYDNLNAIYPGLLSRENLQKPLRDFVDNIADTISDYFRDLIPRVVYLQFFINPNMFAYFDAEYNANLDRDLAKALRERNPALGVAKSELIAQMFHQAYRALLLDAIRNYSSQYAIVNDEIKILLFQYLNLYVGDERDAYKKISTQQNTISTCLARQYGLNVRQEVALSYALQHRTLTIQEFEALCPTVSRRSLQRDLKRLLDARLFTVEGQTNQLVYRPTNLATTYDNLGS
ncbi:MAG: TetR/AcrR family transcriptional regulator [Cyanobacteria bacterium J06639_1]